MGAQIEYASIDCSKGNHGQMEMLSAYVSITLFHD